MSESGDYQPVSWGGSTNFRDARAAYDRDAGRSYATAVASGKTAKDLLPESMSTDSDSPLIVDCDVTGSMSTWPGIIFSKFPYLYHEAKTEYLGDDVAISFGAFDDIFTTAAYPIQARPFGKDKELEAALKELVHTKQGGGSMQENSELMALYRLRRVEMPKAIKKPIYIIITDEKPYDHVTQADAKRVYVDLETRLISTHDIFEELKKKYAVYLVLKPYSDSGADDNPTNTQVRMMWSKLLDDDHIAHLPQAERVMDVILGILAKETGRVDYFKKEIEERQTPAQVDTVYKALKTVHALSAGTKAKKPAALGGKSTFMGQGKGKKSGDLT